MTGAEFNALPHAEQLRAALDALTRHQPAPGAADEEAFYAARGVLTVQLQEAAKAAAARQAVPA